MHRTQVKCGSSDSLVPVPAEGREPFREATRVPLEVPVKVKFDSFGEMQAGFTANVSRGGMFVRGAEFHAVGTLLKFELELSRSSTAVVGLGEVVWIRLEQRDQQRSPGMGIQFRYLDVESLSLLDAAVRKALVDRSVPERPVGPSPDESERSKRLLCEFEEVLARKQLDSTRAPGKQG